MPNLFITQHQLRTEIFLINNVCLTDGRLWPTWGETKAFKINTENLFSIIKGPIIPMREYNIVLGLYWIKVKKIYIEWDSFFLYIKYNSVTYHTAWTMPIDYSVIMSLFISLRVKITARVSTMTSSVSMSFGINQIFLLFTILRMYITFSKNAKKCLRRNF